MIKNIFLSALLLSLPLLAMIDNKPSGLMQIYVASPNLGIAISLNGNVGIGAKDPNAKLDVRGTLRVAYDYNYPTTIIGSGLAGDALSGFMTQYQGGVAKNKISAIASEATYFNNGNVGIGTASPAAKLEVQGTVRQGNLTTYVKTITSGATPTLFNILRQFHDSVNWCVGGILIEEFTNSYDASHFDYGMYFARYGYSGNTADILTKISGSQLPIWGAATQVSGVYYYRDLSITVPAYISITIRITSPIGITTDLSGAQANVVYLY